MEGECLRVCSGMLFWCLPPCVAPPALLFVPLRSSWRPTGAKRAAASALLGICQEMHKEREEKRKGCLLALFVGSAEGFFLIVRLAKMYHCEKISLRLELDPVAALVSLVFWH